MRKRFKTGLVDINGKNIRVGDIVQHNGFIFRIKYGSFNPKTIQRALGEIYDGITFCIPFYGLYGVTPTGTEVVLTDVDYEVIGNIYDNPELMEMKGYFT